MRLRRGLRRIQARTSAAATIARASTASSIGSFAGGVTAGSACGRAGLLLVDRRGTCWPGMTCAITGACTRLPGSRAALVKMPEIASPGTAALPGPVVTGPVLFPGGLWPGGVGGFGWGGAGWGGSGGGSGSGGSPAATPCVTPPTVFTRPCAVGQTVFAAASPTTGTFPMPSAFTVSPSGSVSSGAVPFVFLAPESRPTVSRSGAFSGAPASRTRPVRGAGLAVLQGGLAVAAESGIGARDARRRQSGRGGEGETQCDDPCERASPSMPSGSRTNLDHGTRSRYSTSVTNRPHRAKDAPGVACSAC